MRIMTRWFLIDLLKLLSRFGIAIAIFVAVFMIQLLRPAYGFIDILFILAVGMILGASYIEIQKYASAYVDKKSN